MTTPTHTLIGIALANFGMEKGFLPYAPNIIYPISIIAANAPDFDILFTGIGVKKNHRLGFFHFPSTWALLLIIAYLILDLTGNNELLPIFALVGTGIFSHFVMDTFDAHVGILWFAPFSKKAYNFFRKNAVLPKTIKEFIIEYIRHPVMLAEITVWLIVFWFWLK